MENQAQFDPNIEEETDPVAEALLHDPGLSVQHGPLSIAREQFSTDTVIFLLGLGLTGDEIKLFQKHEIGLEKLSTLTSSDLDYIGIKSAKKKEKIMNCIHKFCKANKSRNACGRDTEIVYRCEDAQALDAVLKHQQTLIKIIPYLKRCLNKKWESLFFQPGISVNHTFERVAVCCVQQAHQIHNEMCNYLHELEQTPQKQSKNVWSRNSRKWWILALIAGSCVPLCVWGSRKTLSLGNSINIWQFFPNPD